MSERKTMQPAETSRQKKRRNVYSGKKTRSLTAMATPGFLLIFVFSYIPMFGLILAFKNFRYDKGIFGSDWCGLENFKFFFSSQDAWRVTRNTLMLNLFFIITTLIASLAVALVLYQITSRIMTKIYQTLIFVPYFLSMAVVAFVVYAFLNVDMGVVNSMLERLGMDPVMWYARADLWPGLLTGINLWKNLGYYVLVYYAALMGLDASCFEAAAIDGATRWQTMVKVAVPMIAPTIIVMVLLQIGKIFYSDFGLFYLVTRNSGSLYSTVDVIDTYIFRSLRVSGDIGVSAAVGLYQSVVGFVLVLASNLAVRRYDADSALF